MSEPDEPQPAREGETRPSEQFLREQGKDEPTDDSCPVSPSFRVELVPGVEVGGKYMLFRAVREGSE